MSTSELERSVGRMEGKMDGLCSDMKEVKGHVEVLRKDYWKRQGSLLVVSGIVAAIISLVCAAIAGIK